VPGARFALDEAMQLRHVLVSMTSLVACGADEPQTAESVAPIATPGIAQAVSCTDPIGGPPGIVGEVGMPPAGDDLQGYVIPTSVFPDALCNDGSPAILYFRPGTGTTANSWLIELEGGGSCSTPQECADRWCSVDTNFGRQNMSSIDYIANTLLNHNIGIAADGLQSTSSGPFANYNHVFIHYCSSDGWAGTSPSVDGDAQDPANNADITFSTRFNGNAILEAAIRVLRRDGATLPAFSPTGVSMPDLDDSSGDVVIAGGSAGGAGVIFQLDRTVAGLQLTHTAGGFVPYYSGLIDSAFPPQLSTLSYQFTDECPSGCTWEQYVEATEPYYTHVTDDSCETYHAALGNDYECLDLTHLVHHHLGTPFFLRQGEPDKLLSKTYSDRKKLAISSSAANPMTVTEFAALVFLQALGISNWSSADEPPSLLPGAFIPDCKTHYPVHDDDAWFLTTINSYTWDQIWQNWRARSGATIEIGIQSTSVCACNSGTNC
jgi:hypothetical protein